MACESMDHDDGGIETDLPVCEELGSWGGGGTANWLKSATATAGGQHFQHVGGSGAATPHWLASAAATADTALLPQLVAQWLGQFGALKAFTGESASQLIEACK